MNNIESPLRVAIVGASGIGKNHAAWFQKNGAEICAFAGSSSQSLAATSRVLQSRLGYAPRGYTSLSQLLQSEKPDAMCIASPPQLHFEHVKLCLENGVHTLCEKPLVYDADQSHAALISQARELCELAEARGVLLATQMQYCFLTDKLCELAGVAPEEIEDFEMEMETKNLKPGKSHETVWIELAPHPLSVLQKVFPGAELKENSIQCEIGHWETRAAFEVAQRNGNKIKARVITRCNPSTPAPLRRFTINGVAFDYAGRKNESGEFLTFLSGKGQEIEMPDLVDILIGNFLAAWQNREPLFVTGPDGARNVQWMLEILERGKRH